MRYSDEEGYAAVDHDARYKTGARITLGVIVALVGLGSSIPSMRDWAWRTFLPDDYYREHGGRFGNSNISDAAARASIENLLDGMHRCADGTVSVDVKCADGSTGKPLDVKRR